jgi:hypothetical protein
MADSLLRAGAIAAAGGEYQIHSAVHHGAALERSSCAFTELSLQPIAGFAWTGIWSQPGGFAAFRV